MIERDVISRKMKEFQVQEYIFKNLKRVGHSHTRIQRTPLGEKVIIHASRPGLVVGRKGQNIKKLTKTLKKEFELENPQIEINEIENPFLDAQIVAEMIADSLERFGSKRFKGIGHKMMENIMRAGAMGVEILISGKIPSSRGKRWRFYQGYLKKSGDIAIIQVLKSQVHAQIQSGTVGVQVKIMPPGIKLPSNVLIKEIEEKIEEVPAKDAEEKVIEEKNEDKGNKSDE